MRSIILRQWRDPNIDVEGRVDLGTVERTRPVQPVATCRQSPDLHKPAIVKLLLLFTVSNSGLLSVKRLRPASHAHFRHSHIHELICGFNSSIDV